MLYPIMTTSRELVDLNGIWNFKLDHGTGFAEEWFGRPLQQAIPMPVPASYNDLYEGAEFRDHIGWVWYEREIVVPDHFFTQRMVLRFGSVTHAARVYLNGQLVVEHQGGFTPFEAEINAFVKHRQKSPDGRGQQYCGLYHASGGQLSRRRRSRPGKSGDGHPEL